MDKLKTLQTIQWKNIDSQAEFLFELISKYQNENKNKVVVNGIINKVNRAILEQNGFKVLEHPGMYHSLDYIDSYTITW
jgi:hypothetical protein